MADPVSPVSAKRRADGLQDPSQPVDPDGFIADHDAQESGADDEDDEEKPKSDKKAGRRKIKIEFIQDKSRRHITFSKRKAGIMKKAYELSTLTGTQVLLLVVSETGLVYTFTTAKLQPLVTQPEGKNLIQACLNAPHGSVPSSMPVGTPLGRSNPMPMPPHHQQPPQTQNVPGGLAIGAAAKDADDADDDADADTAPDTARTRKRRRASSSAGAAQSASAQGQQQQQQQQQQAQQQAPPTRNPTSPHARPQPIPGGQPPALAIPGGQSLPGALDTSPRTAQPSPGYSNAPGAYGAPGADMYGAPPQGHQGYPPAGAYGYDAGGPGQGAPGMPQGHAGAWGAPQVQQGGHYARR